MNQSYLDLGPQTACLKSPAIACSELPQARFEQFGVNALSDTELLALTLLAGIPGHEALGLASRIMAEAGSLTRLGAWQATDFKRLKGIGQTKAKQLVAMTEIARRMMMPPAKEMPILNRPELIAEYFKPIIHGLEVEKFWVLCLNRKNRLKKLVEVTSGTATSSLAHPREVFRTAIKESATAVVCVHNHPSGSPGPSASDVQVTRQLRDAAKAVDIELLDHVIVGRAEADETGQGWYSFRSAGVL